jgi:hypothetical protein
MHIDDVLGWMSGTLSERERFNLTSLLVANIM